MIRVVPFSREHLSALDPQDGQRVELVTLARVEALEQAWSFTVFDEGGRVLMCAGALPDTEGVWWGWALLASHARCRMLALSRAVRLFAARTPAERIRIAVRWGFEEGHRWARMLGFAPLRELHRIEGIWCAIYERSVQHGV